MEKRPFFQAAMAGLGKYCMGGHGCIGVYRVKLRDRPGDRSQQYPVLSTCRARAQRALNTCIKLVLDSRFC